MPKQVELRLIPQPGAKPEFLAMMEPNNATPNWWESTMVEKVVVLEGYTRDEWSLDTATQWQSVQVKSVDGRNKLPGFVNYLRERKKTAFGRFGPDKVWVISFKQMSSSILTCRVAAIPKIPNCPLRPKGSATNSNNNRPSQPPTSNKPQSKPTTATSSSAGGTKKKKGFGLLGNLVGAQKRTNQQVITATAKKAPPPGSSGAGANGAGGGGGSGGAEGGSGVPAEELKTAGQVLAEFRQEMEQEMLDFDLSGESVLKVKVDVASKLKMLSEEDKHSGRISMEVLKYIVYEQAEEVNEEWIAHKEPTEFMDEATIAIYKEGAAPPEVLEDINKAELPDEVRGHQRALQEQRQKQEMQRATKQDKAKQKAALRGDIDDFAALNTNKRDRRTIEDFERQKRQKTD